MDAAIVKNVAEMEAFEAAAMHDRVKTLSGNGAKQIKNSID